MRFLWPDLLWLLLAIPVLVAAYLFALSRRKKQAVRYASLELIRGAIGPGQRMRRHLPPALFLLAMLASIVAVSRPSATITLPSEYLTLVLAMDVSRSMQANDVKPTRITAAQEAAREFVRQLPGHVRLGIVSFAGTAAIVQSPTDSRDDLIAAIDRFQLQRATATGSGLILSLSVLFPEDGIDLESVIFDRGMARGPRPLPLDGTRRDPGKEGKAAKAPTERKVVPPGSYTAGGVILLSDGRRTTGPDPLEAAKMAAERGVRVYTVGFGSHDGITADGEGLSYYMRLDEETLKAIAKMTGGEYFHAGTAADLSKVYENLSTRFSMERRETEISALVAAVAASLLVLAGLLSVLWFHRGPPVGVPHRAGQAAT